VIIFTSWPLERTPVHIEWEAGWASVAVWTFWRRKCLLPLTGSEPRAVQPVGQHIYRDSENEVKVCNLAVACLLSAGGVDPAPKCCKFVSVRRILDGGVLLLLLLFTSIEFSLSNSNPYASNK
jgi:hypothetical protein